MAFLTISQLQDYLALLVRGKPIADLLFASLLTDFAISEETDFSLQYPDQWTKEVSAAEQDVRSWEDASQRKQAYTAGELARARFSRKSANDYEKHKGLEFSLCNALHDALIRKAVPESGLAERMIQSGKEGKKFGLLEISSRLTPALTFPDASHYFELSVIPYGRKAREVLGEQTGKALVSASVARESARNLRERFDLAYVLAETSAAPRRDVPKSGKKPELHLCAISPEGNLTEGSYVIETLFRDHFDARVRELMYGALSRLYGVNDVGEEGHGS